MAKTRQKKTFEQVFLYIHCLPSISSLGGLYVQCLSPRSHQRVSRFSVPPPSAFSPFLDQESITLVLSVLNILKDSMLRLYR